MKFLREATKKLFQPVRPRLAEETSARPVITTADDKLKCLEYVERAWRVHMVLQQQYRSEPIVETIDRFARTRMLDLTESFAWPNSDDKLQILAIVFAAIIRSGTHSETEVRDAIKQVWPRLVDPPSQL
jgi:hypothetical protein